MNNRPDQKINVMAFPQTHAKAPDGGPLWMRWLRGSSQVLQDFEEYMNFEIDRCRKQYAGKIVEGKDVLILAGYEQALTNLLTHVKLYEIEEHQNVAFQQEKRGQP